MLSGLVKSAACVAALALLGPVGPAMADVTPSVNVAGQPPSAEAAEDSSPGSSAGEDPALVELVDERTLTSRTFRLPDGGMQTEVFTHPLHFRAADGSLARIDNTLVESERPGFAAENAANRYQLLIPEDAGSRPVQFQANGEWVSFGADGADGAPLVQDNQASINGLGTSTRLEYEATSAGVKESVILSAAPGAGEETSWSFELDASDGVAPHLNASGGLDFVDDDGAVVFAAPAPFMVDSSGTSGGYSDAVSFDLEEFGDTWRLTMAADATWLRDPKRVYPVKIDPTITVSGAADCWINQFSPGTPNCGAGSDWIRAGFLGGKARRALLKFNVDAIPANASVSEAEVMLHIDNTQTTNVAIAEYVARRMTQSWTGQATWATHNGTTAWAQPGGDYAVSSAPGTELNGSTTGYRALDATAMTDAWVNGTHPNLGMLVKQRVENVDSLLGFFSSNSANLNQWPKLIATYDVPPTTPIGLVPAEGVATNDATPTFAATYRDPNAGDRGYINFEIWDATSATRIRSGRTPASTQAPSTVPVGDEVLWSPEQELTEEATYQWRVQGCDGAGGGCSPWSAKRDLTLDTTAPNEPYIQDGPDSPTGDSAPAWIFYDEESMEFQPGTEFQCQLSKGANVVSAFTTCSETQAYDVTGSGPGTYTFAVRERDPAGNLSPSTTHSFTLDPAAPEPPVILSTPSDPAAEESATFTFSGDATGSFECELTNDDGDAVQPFTSCSSPKTYDLMSLDEGFYKFSVRQWVAGEVSAPAMYSFTVFRGGVLPPPETDVIEWTGEDCESRDLHVRLHLDSDDITKDVGVDTGGSQECLQTAEPIEVEEGTPEVIEEANPSSSDSESSLGALSLLGGGPPPIPPCNTRKNFIHTSHTLQDAPRIDLAWLRTTFGRKWNCSSTWWSRKNGDLYAISGSGPSWWQHSRPRFPFVNWNCFITQTKLCAQAMAIGKADFHTDFLHCNFINQDIQLSSRVFTHRNGTRTVVFAKRGSCPGVFSATSVKVNGSRARNFGDAGIKRIVNNP
jgi:hypothetical protein